MSCSSSSTHDQISLPLPLPHTLLPSSLTTHPSNPISISMLRFCTSKTAQQNALQDGIYKASSTANVSSSSVALITHNETDDCDCESEVALPLSDITPFMCAVCGCYVLLYEYSEYRRVKRR